MPPRLAPASEQGLGWISTEPPAGGTVTPLRFANPLPLDIPLASPYCIVMARRSPLAVVPQDTPLTPRLMHLVHQEEEPCELQWGVQCIRDGGSEGAAALKSGLTLAEWRRVKEWGAAGHPAFAQFYRDYLFAKGDALQLVQSAVHHRALDDGELAYARAAEEIILDGRIGGTRVDGGTQTQVNVVINKDF